MEGGGADFNSHFIMLVVVVVNSVSFVLGNILRYSCVKIVVMMVMMVMVMMMMMVVVMMMMMMVV
jgi:hypothetical protein